MRKLNINILQAFILLFTISVFFISCTDDSDTIYENEEVDFKMRESNYVTWGDVDVEKILDSNTSESFITNTYGDLVYDSFELVKDFGLTDGDLEEMFSINSDDFRSMDRDIIDNLPIEDQANIFLGGLLIRIHLESIGNANPNITNGNITGEQIVDCFVEATGVAAGVALVSGLVNQTLTGTQLVAAFKQVVKKVGPRTLGAVGLALMAAEFSWCITRA